MRFQFDEGKEYLHFEDERCERLTKKCLKSVFITFFILAVIFASIYAWFYSNYYLMTVTGRSMQPTLNVDISYQSQSQDCVLVDKDATIDYGDMIIIKNPDDPESGNTIIKRVLAKEGDKFTIIKIDGLYHFLLIKNGFLNIEVLEEDYIKDYVEWSGEESYIDMLQGVVYEEALYENFFNPFGEFYSPQNVSQESFNGKLVYFYQLDEGEIFYMGDNRANSSDGRFYGPVGYDLIKGKVVKIIYNGAYSDFFFVRGYYQLKGLFEYFVPKLINLFSWKG